MYFITGAVLGLVVFAFAMVTIAVMGSQDTSPHEDYDDDTEPVDMRMGDSIEKKRVHKDNK